jgi:hypothetical protein
MPYSTRFVGRSDISGSRCRLMAWGHCDSVRSGRLSGEMVTIAVQPHASGTMGEFAAAHQVEAIERYPVLAVRRFVEPEQAEFRGDDGPAQRRTARRKPSDEAKKNRASARESSVISGASAPSPPVLFDGKSGFRLCHFERFEHAWLGSEWPAIHIRGGAKGIARDTPLTATARWSWERTA